MRSARGDTFLKALTAVYYVSWIFIGNFILLNLFLAILIDAFEAEERDSNLSDQTALEAEKKAAIIRRKHINELKEKRRKKLGTKAVSSKSNANLKKSSEGFKNKVFSLTGNEIFKEDYDMVEDLDDLDPNTIQEMLVRAKVITDKKQENIKEWTLPYEIYC